METNVNQCVKDTNNQNGVSNDVCDFFLTIIHVFSCLLRCHQEMHLYRNTGYLQRLFLNGYPFQRPLEVFAESMWRYLFDDSQLNALAFEAESKVREKKEFISKITDHN